MVAVPVRAQVKLRQLSSSRWALALAVVGVAGIVVRFWIWPPYNIVNASRPGFYASDVFYCALLMLLALRVVERPDRTRVGLFGLVLGLAYWETSQIVPIALPLIAWTIWKQPRALRYVWLAAPLAVLGALPWLLWNVRHDFGSLDMLSF